MGSKDTECLTEEDRLCSRPSPRCPSASLALWRRRNDDAVWRLERDDTEAEALAGPGAGVGCDAEFGDGPLNRRGFPLAGLQYPPSSS